MTTSNHKARSTRSTAGTATNPVHDATKILTDAAHVVVGFGVLGWNKAQVSRRELMKNLSGQRLQVENQLDGAKEQISTAIRNLDARMAPVRTDIENTLDRFSERLPAQARGALTTARTIARDTEHSVRQAVGAL